MKALLFINGDPPAHLPNPADYDLVACTDGAVHYLQRKKFDLTQLNFISGDFDSIKNDFPKSCEHLLIETPDQDKTDFEKALELLVQKNATSVDVYGGSGGEMDHFLGNLTVAHHFKNRLQITFYDQFSTYFFIPKIFRLSNVLGKMISLYPFPNVEGLTTSGLNWEITEGNLSVTGRIGTRNFARRDEVSIEYSRGDLLVFVGGIYHGLP